MLIERLKTLNKTSERVKTRLSDELSETKKRLRDQIKTSKEIDDKYTRYKDCLTKTKSQLNRLTDDVSDVLKRGQPNSNSIKTSATTPKSQSISTDLNKKSETTPKKEPSKLTTQISSSSVNNSKSEKKETPANNENETAPVLKEPVIEFDTNTNGLNEQVAEVAQEITNNDLDDMANQELNFESLDSPMDNADLEVPDLDNQYSQDAETNNLETNAE